MAAPRVTKKMTTVRSASKGSIGILTLVMLASGVALYFAVNQLAHHWKAFDGTQYSVTYADTPEGGVDGYAGSYGQPTATVDHGALGIVGPTAAAAGILLVFVGGALVAVEATRETVVEETIVPDGEVVTEDVVSVVTSILDFAKSARAPVVAMIAGLLIAGGGLWMTWSSMNSAGSMAETSMKWSPSRFRKAEGQGPTGFGCDPVWMSYDF